MQPPMNADERRIELGRITKVYRRPSAVMISI